MSKQKHHSKKRSTHTRRPKSLGGIGAVAAHAQKEWIKPIAMLGGLLGGALLAKGIDKIDALKVDPSVEGFSVKKMAKPAILIVVGAGTSYLGKKNDIDAVEYLGYGVAAAGVVSGIKVAFVKADLFSGLGEIEGGEEFGATVDAEYKKDQISEINKLVEAAKFEPNLPVSGFEEEQEQIRQIARGHSVGDADYMSGMSNQSGLLGENEPM